MNFDFCLQTNKQTKKVTVLNNFYFLVLDNLESWLHLMTDSMLALERRQVGTFEIVNHKHTDLASREGSTLSVLTSLFTGSKYFKMRLKIYYLKTTKIFYIFIIHKVQYRKQFQVLLLRRTSSLFVNLTILYLLSNITNRET